MTDTRIVAGKGLYPTDASVDTLSDGRRRVILRRAGAAGDLARVSMTQAEADRLRDDLAAAPPPPPDAGVQATQADALVDTIGVNTHLGYTNTAYNNYGMTKSKLIELGVRHIRDHALINRQDVYDELNDLDAVAGIKATLIMSDPNNTYGYGTLSQVLDVVRTKVRPSVDAVEGPNEFDAVSGRAPDWPAKLRAYQQQLYSAVKGDPALAALDVAGPSLVWKESHATLGDISSACDHGTVHNYYGGRAPGWPFLGWPNNLGEAVAAAQLNAPGKRPYSTETGYHNAVPSNSGHLGTPAVVAGRYMPRLLLLQADDGVARTCVYELVNWWSSPGDLEMNFGLLNSDWTPKPAFTAVKNLIALLRDPGPAFAPGRLDFQLGGDVANVRTQLYQKRNGAFYLAVWLELPSWDPVARTNIAVPPQAVALALAGRSSATVHTLDDAGALTSTARSFTGTLTLAVSDRVTLVQL